MSASPWWSRKRGSADQRSSSSAGAVCGAKPKNAALGLFTEEDWNDAATIETLPYYYSKVNNNANGKAERVFCK